MRLGAVDVMERLQTCLAAAERVLAYASTEDGKVRNAKLTLQASEHLRRCLDTAARISDTIARAETIGEFNQAVVDAVVDEVPEAADRILARIERTARLWPGRRVGP